MALLNSITGGGLPELAVDTNDTGTISITGDFTTLTTVVNATGKFAFSYIRLQAATAENYTFILTIDGVEIWNVVKAIAGTNTDIFGSLAASPLYECKESFKLEIQSTTDTSTTAVIGLRAIK